MKKRALVLIALMVILASGCITIRMETKINQDGSGTKSFILALDKSMMSMIESMAEESGAATEDIWESARAGASSIQGATVEDFSDDESEGIKVTVPFGSLEELVALSSSDAFEGADIISVKKDGDITTLNATITVGDITSELDQASDQSLEGFDLGDIELEYSYAVEVEGNILEYAPKNYASIEGNKVTWDLTQSQADTVELMLKWEPSGGSSIVVILLALGAIGGLALVVIGVILSLRSQKANRAQASLEQSEG
jgi:hypothetical protein